MHTYYEFEVSLRGIEPRIWRRFLLPGTASFKALHRAIQDASGCWRDYHLFVFSDTGGRRPEPMTGSPLEDMPEIPSPGRVRLSRYFRGSTPRACLYEYDFGDDWHLDVIHRDVVGSDERFERRLIGGERAFPPEDCGGVGGYYEIVEFLRTGKHPYGDDPAELFTWIGQWRPENFDLAAAQAAFDR